MNDFNYYDSGENRQAVTLNKFTAKTFMWMVIGLLASFASAMAVLYVPAIGRFIFGGPFGYWSIVIAEFAVVIVLSLAIRKLSPGAATVLFFIYSIVNGLTLSTVFIAFDITSVVYAFVASAALFGAMALYGTITKKDLTKFGAICIFALLGMALFSLIGMLFGMGFNSILYNCLMIAIFMGLTAFDMQNLKRYYYSFEGNEDMLHKCAIISALQLYLDFINIFLRILSISGKRR